MLSRVAAVKAPRTHNRRRVAGSSGRREGRESEPQGCHMTRHLFYSAVLLILVVMMMSCGICGAEKPAMQSTGPQFEWKDVNCKGDSVTVEILGVPGLLRVGNDVFAVAEAQCKGGANIFTGIASQRLTKGNANTPVEVLKEVEKIKALEKHGSSEAEKINVSRPTTVVEGSDIYMLVGKNSPTAAGSEQNSGADGWEFFLVKLDGIGKGDISQESQWKNTNDVSLASFDEQHQSWTRLISGGGSGANLKDGTLVFPVEGRKKESESGKTVSLIVSFLKNTKSWTLSKWMSADGCSAPSVVEWKDNQLMMMTACDDGRRRVYESGDKGESWTEALGTLSRVWGNKQDGSGVRSGFTAAKIGNGVEDDKRNVMLVTLPVYSKEKDSENKEKEKSELHLWLTDNTHIVDIGPVSGKDDDVAASSLLYKSAGSETINDELIALYEKKGSEEPQSPGMVSVRLTERLERVKDVLATWKKVDDIVSKLCPTPIVAQGSPTTNDCSAANITNGLVGFLSGNFSETTWRDEYLGVNATVKKGKKEGVAEAVRVAAGPSDGVKFHGAWAEWPVGAQGENQLYQFANYNFTLVATVSIDGDPKEGSPVHLMGVKMNGDEKTVLLGLSYNQKENKWTLLCGGKPNSEKPSSKREAEKTYQVVILLRNGTQGTAYVDGQRVGDPQCALQDMDPKGISHFFIGGGGGSAGSQEGVPVTVTNVLLYNRPLSSEEITALTKRLSIQKQKDLQTETGVIRAPEVSALAAPEAVPVSDRDGQHLTAQELLKRGEDPGSGGASKSTSTTVTTPSSGSQSAERLASGGFRDGNKNVNAASPSNDNPLVRTGGGDTVQGNGAQQPSVGALDTADTKLPNAEGEGQDGLAVNSEASYGEKDETPGGTGGREEKQIRDVNATALSSNLGNLSQANNTDAGTMRESGMMLPPLLLLLGLWGFAAL
ncbi:trans-sialidase, putative [Trypanosoma cruzi marinkellei]|uniref:Trans-sialidase, putative n=1 Tax=Trypanosoma cruzi marinkellei TaxID=85056 RepID=K2NH02_TRYCR|nr:trans-sialidase, putative [Trypanosoma cruzi marinkellei]